MRVTPVLKQILPAGAFAAAVLALWTAPAGATIRIQKDAIALGYAADNCAYCHVFDSEHMKERGAGNNGVRVVHLDCYACHHGRLPKTGERLLTERGLFLTAAKRQFRAEKVDAAWLSGYREPVAKPKPKGSPRP